LYIICVNFNGPLFANTFRMAMYISSFDLLIFEPSFVQVDVYLSILCRESVYKLFDFLIVLFKQFCFLIAN
jgi:hypothetical protein